MKLIPIIILAILLIAVMTWTRRARLKTATADAERRNNLAPGAEVMTTSGLYGTVTKVHEDEDAVQLQIAPGVEVKWTIAALRSVTELPPKYRSAIDGRPSASD